MVIEKVGKTTRYRIAQVPKIPGHKVGKHWRLNGEAIDRWLEEHKRTLDGMEGETE